ncbi:MAG: acyl-CoA dehydrogenase family protein [Alphaproteobacteria bacterium]
MDEQRIVADAREWYRDSWDPDLTVGEWFRLMYESGWGYPTWPEQWSGKGLPTSGAKLVRAERRAAGALGPPSGIGPTLLAPMLFRHGNDSQCDRFLRGMAYGGETTCQMLSEPDAGSDLAGARTSAERDGRGAASPGRRCGPATPASSPTACSSPARTGRSPSTACSFFRTCSRSHVEACSIAEMNCRPSSTCTSMHAGRRR